MRLFVFAMVLVFVVGQLEAQTKSPPHRSTTNLFAYPGAVLEGNRVVCGVDNAGQMCVGGESPLGGGGFWPKGTVDQYIFNSGLQVAALIPAGAGFAWAGDTTGAYFFDPRGDQGGSTPRANVFNSLDSADALDWPANARIQDAATYDGRLIGRNIISEQDSWTRYWDGAPTSLGGRTHPMGLLIDQRTLQWNYPTGNQDILYVVSTLYNVTARSAGAYANPTIPPELQSDIAAVGRVFQDSVEPAFGVSIPDGGYVFDSMYVQLGMDHDIAIFSQNYGTMSLPFGMGIGYTGTFLPEVGWALSPDPFGAAPFAAAPGLLGTVFVKSPAPFAMFTNTTGGGSFPSSVGVTLLWRRMSGNLAPSDNQCSPFTNPAEARARHVCFLTQGQADSRYQMSIGPFGLAPGESKTLVLAYILAAPLDTAKAYIGGDLKPGIPSTGDSIAADTTKIRAIERVAGWRTQSDLNANGSIEANEVVTARRSLLHKAQVAQAIVDAKFLLPSAPEAPDFFLIPGDNRVTVVWQPSTTEKLGDPYFALASDRASPLYDPNFRQFDVEGYRIYRGTSPRALILLDQVDFDNTSFVDYVGALAYPGQCAPELGVTTDCPVAFPRAPDTTAHITRPAAGAVVQIAEGKRIISSTDLVTTLEADTFPARTSGFPLLGETGVTYAFTDSAVLNSRRYYYAVTAFDLNSIRSGPSSFESPRLVKAVSPRASSGQETVGQVSLRLLGSDDTPLDTAAPVPSLDPSTSIFSGPMPPTDGISMGFAAMLPQLLGGGRLTVTIDSVRAGQGNNNLSVYFEPLLTRYFMTAVSSADTVHLVVPLAMDQFSGERSNTVRFAAVTTDSAQATRFGAAPRVSVYGEVTLTTPGIEQLVSGGHAGLFGFPQFAFNGPRWWSGATNENTPNPNGGNCAPPTFGCGSTIRVPTITLTAGRIAGITLFHPQAYSSVTSFPMPQAELTLGTVTRAADFRVVWGAAGVVDTVYDETHHVPVPFAPNVAASWGVLTQASFASVDPLLTRDGKNGLLTWADLFCVAPLPEHMELLSFPGDTSRSDCGGSAQTPAVLQNVATLSPIAIRDSASSYLGTSTAAYTATGNGFIFYLAGHFFLMQMGSLPAAGTVWHARYYSGTITGSAAQANFAFNPAIRPPAVPGLRVELSFQGSQLNRLATTDSMLRLVHTLPDPFYLASGFETSPDTLALKFVHLPALAIVRIYSQSGILVQALTNNDPTGGGELTWDLKSRSGKRVASGVYFYHVETPDHRRKIGRFTVISGKFR